VDVVGHRHRRHGELRRDPRPGLVAGLDLGDGADQAVEGQAAGGVGDQLDGGVAAQLAGGVAQHGLGGGVGRHDAPLGVGRQHALADALDHRAVAGLVAVGGDQGGAAGALQGVDGGGQLVDLVVDRGLRGHLRDEGLAAQVVGGHRAQPAGDGDETPGDHRLVDQHRDDGHQQDHQRVAGEGGDPLADDGAVLRLEVLDEGEAAEHVELAVFFVDQREAVLEGVGGEAGGAELERLLALEVEPHRRHVGEPGEAPELHLDLVAVEGPGALGQRGGRKAADGLELHGQVVVVPLVGVHRFAQRNGQGARTAHQEGPQQQAAHHAAGQAEVVAEGLTLGRCRKAHSGSGGQ